VVLVKRIHLLTNTTPALRATPPRLRRGISSQQPFERIDEQTDASNRMRQPSRISEGEIQQRSHN